jgi:hypothetical protein
MNNIIFGIAMLSVLNIIVLKATTQESTTINLAELQKKKQFVVYNRQISVADDAERNAVSLTENGGEGLAWLRDVTFSTGTIEIDLKGQDVYQKSFLGIAFHGVNDSTYDAVYFRPFNFKTTDSVRRMHAVQYISHPIFTWRKLREEQNGIFEKEVVPAIDPNQWFHAKIEIGQEDVRVFVNYSPVASLIVKKLNNRTDGKIGLWTGDGAGGSFSNLVISK